jgi:large subunit ribosomal protein L35
MPKMKTNRTAYKKYRVGKNGVKRAQAGTSHNTGKKRQKRKRLLRGNKSVDKTNMGAVKGQLPYLFNKSR